MLNPVRFDKKKATKKGPEQKAFNIVQELVLYVLCVAFKNYSKQFTGRIASISSMLTVPTTIPELPLLEVTNAFLSDNAVLLYLFVLSGHQHITMDNVRQYILKLLCRAHSLQVV